MDLGLRDRTYIVTGASGGLGFATAKALVEEGARVVISSRKAESIARASAALGSDRAVGIPVVPADAWPEVKPLARWVLSRAGGTGCVREFCDAVWEAQR